jgi:hypothetical protein
MVVIGILMYPYKIIALNIGRVKDLLSTAMNRQEQASAITRQMRRKGFVH